ncbi:Zinc finger protein castor 1 [Blomia tropicalis]|nr:Zinc finger protein castor 1 [Blomia tropicalis]
MNYQDPKDSTKNKFGCPFTVSIQDKTLTRLEHYKFHEEQYCQFIQSADCVHRNSAVNTHQPTNEPLTIQQLLSLKPNQLTNQTLVGGQHSNIKPISIDCGYSFCDKTRFVQHTARHERLDSLMGGDFQQFRSSVSCMQSECPFGSTVGGNLINNNCGGGVGGGNNMKTSHFHCLKCDYVCADTNKVVAHRRQHAKMDNISAAGFEKYSPSQDCQKEMCNYRLKQTHYHCLTCNYSVLGLSQMSSHKFKHQQQQQQQLQSQD